MQYRKDKYGNDISALGYGCMRFTKKGNSADLDKAEKEVMAAIEAGVNYFDTAYVYAGNEVAVGEILHRNHCREKINLATKLPHYLIKSIDGVEKMFQEELRRLQTDYIDLGMIHYVDSEEEWEQIQHSDYLDYVIELKNSGVIHHIGMSSHNPKVAMKAAESGFVEMILFSSFIYVPFFVPNIERPGGSIPGRARRRCLPETALPVKSANAASSWRTEKSRASAGFRTAAGRRCT